LTTEGQSTFDERLIAQNVRYFLGNENDVNREIRETLISGNSEDFWFLNNGLTIVCDQIMPVANGCHPLTLVNPQIVNGGQTAHVLHSVGSDTLMQRGKGSKLIETNNAEFTERIGLASNTQSRILGRDLRANDHVQTRLAEIILSHGYFYRRKRGERSPLPTARTIDAARAGSVDFSLRLWRTHEK